MRFKVIFKKYMLPEKKYQVVIFPLTQFRKKKVLFNYRE